ncbi:putative lipoprotein [Vibrio xiamenensis]|uniref:Putative lipoprotein n=1 Tax=Vibrio xiamenensis TaxID=861298 RepID=A0A1G7Y0R8_9VIBR|nr:YbaY family lipoprotein [Vibrio xiamenensis]SDG89984.1 putative lipoprotein [Vibrio xiamenensis]
MKKAFTLFMSVAVASVLAGCQTSDSESSMNQVQSISGSLTYKERLALPDDAVVTVMLRDVSRADAPAKILTSQQFETQGAQVPFHFELLYDKDQIDTRHTYSVGARIEVNGKLRFITDTSYPVITDDKHTKVVDIKLIGVSG